MFSRRSDAQVAASSSKSFSRSQKLGRSNFSFSKDSRVSKQRYEAPRRRAGTATSFTAVGGSETSSHAENLTSAIVTLVVGPAPRFFAAHEHILASSPFFRDVLQNQMMDTQNKRIALADEEPEIFAVILEYLYKGDYYPRLVKNKKQDSYEIEPDDGRGNSDSTVYHRGVDGEDLLKDTVIYCAAEKYGLEELKRKSLIKQGLQSGIQASVILSSARYAYANTPDTDSKLRAHYLALIIRSRSTFRRSGTMQLEMFNGGTQLFFDLFVAMSNHVDDVHNQAMTPRSSRSNRPF